MCQLYKEILQEQPQKHHISFTLAKVLATQNLLPEALYWYSHSITIAMSPSRLLETDPGTLATYFMHRALVFEALGQREESREDLKKISEADPNFMRNYHAQAVEFEEEGKREEAE